MYKCDKSKYLSNNDNLVQKSTRVKTQHNTRQHDTTQDNTSTTQHNTNATETTRDDRSATRGNTSTKQPKIYSYLFVSSLHT